MGDSTGRGCPETEHSAMQKTGLPEDGGSLKPRRGEGSLHKAEELRQGSPCWLWLVGSIRTHPAAKGPCGSPSTVTVTCSAHLGESCRRRWAGGCKAGSGT